jgi:hypothetical protein
MLFNNFSIASLLCNMQHHMNILSMPLLLILNRCYYAYTIGTETVTWLM